MKLSLVIPVFNEEETIPKFYDAITSHNIAQKFDIELLFINDGSDDSTLDVLSLIKSSNKFKNVTINILDFSRNFGKEPALFAGLEHATGDAVIPIDVDLQDPIDVIPQLIEKYQEGYDVVLAKRVDRSSDTYLKRKTAQWFYSFHNKISKPKIEPNVGDFRLLSREVVEAIKLLQERQLFMKGILSWVGFKTAIVEYSREERVAGNTKFNTLKLWDLALEGITSFSSFPLKVWTYLGLFIAGISFIYAGGVILSKILFGNPVPGYPSIMATILFIGGIQLIGIGILGEYIGRIYIESKNRPRYILKKHNEDK